jgi:TRAP-type uncharacterized transport system fused permease subunit
MRLGFLAFVVPFAFCYDPGLLMEGGLAANLWAIATGAIAIFAFGYFWMGYISRPIPLWLRVVLLAAGVYSLFPGTLPVLLSGAAVLGAYLFSRFAGVKQASGTAI